MPRTEINQDKAARATRAELVARLRARFPEIEAAIFAHIRGVSEPVADADSAYVAGLRAAVAAAIDYGLKCIEGEDWAVPVPPETARQARLAARDGVRLDTVLRRYVAGSNLLEEFIVVEAEDLPSEVLRQVIGERGPQLDRLMEAMSSEYIEELERAKRSSAERQADRVLHLLEGNGLASPAEIDYDFETWHVGMILRGANAQVTARVLAERLGSRLLDVPRDPETVWAWLGSLRRPAAMNLKQFVAGSTPAEVSVAIGEPRQGLGGWRLTHREAQMALGVMLRRPRKLLRGRDVILLAGIMRDETLVRALLDTYLGPLRGEGPAGTVLIETLRSYFSVGGNAAAAAVNLGVTRHTVQRRIRTVERKLGQLLHTCQAELQVALQVDEIQ